MKHVLITGAAGFIGGYTVSEFVQHGWHVLALVHCNISHNLKIMAEEGSLSIIHGDITDIPSFEKTLREEIEKRQIKLQAIVHCAGRVSDVGRRRVFKKANYESVQHLARLTKELDVDRFIFISSTDVYGLRDFNGESEEELPLSNNTKNLYPEFKIKAEEWIHRELPPERFSIIRPAAVWGAGDPTLTPRIVNFLHWSPWIIHFGKWKGQNRWPLAHVRNVAAAVFLAASSPNASGKAINVLDAEITSIDEFYRILASIYLPNKKFYSITFPLWLGKMFGQIVSGLSNLLSLNKPFMDPSLYAIYSVSSHLDFNNNKFKELLSKANRDVCTHEEAIDEIIAFRATNSKDHCVSG
ncbi:NAD-dependent epimerase/dehydratase family protein [Planctomycetota bacterium]